MREIVELPRLPPRAVESHKGTYGRVLVVAGSRGMSGAAILCGTAVMKSGAGLCTVACPESIQATVSAGFPCYTTYGLWADATGRLREEASDDACILANGVDVIAMGCGLAASDGVGIIVNDVLKTIGKPIVLDADALNALAPWTLALRKSATVLTPHPGEFARLTGKPSPTSHDQRIADSVAFAAVHGLIVVLKGHRTIVTDGDRYFLNTTGNPGMATGGSGDVLTGVIAALIGQGLDAFDAAVLGVHVHGRAGDLAAERVGQVGLTAVDILDHIPQAFR